MIKEIFEVKNNNHISSGKFSISSIGCCKRKKFMEIKKLWHEDYDAKTQLTFATGDAFHRLAVKTIMENGDKLNIRVCSAEVDIPEQRFFSGRADLIVSDGKEMMVTDVKSCSDYTLMMVDKGEVSQSYIDQVNLYLHFFNLKTGYILFFGKHKAVVKEAKVVYDETRALELIADVEDFMINYVEKNICPDKCTEEISPWGCKCCETMMDDDFTAENIKERIENRVNKIMEKL